jgi:rubrerythrin
MPTKRSDDAGGEPSGMTRRGFLAVAGLPAAALLFGPVLNFAAVEAAASGEPAAGPFEVEYDAEAQIGRKYTAFAEKAAEEGYPEAAHLFRAVAHAEEIHARLVLAAMKIVKGTKENLQASADFENYVVQEVLPGSVERASAGGDGAAAVMFRRCLGASKTHAVLFTAAGEQLRSGKDLAAGELAVCPGCGNVLSGAIPDRCPVCNAEGARFLHIA